MQEEINLVGSFRRMGPKDNKIIIGAETAKGRISERNHDLVPQTPIRF